MKTQIKVNETRFPRLTRAVLRRVDRETLEDVCRGGADAGWSGFTYYTDTVAFYKAHKGDILDLLKQTASDMGEGAIATVRGFNCLSHRDGNGITRHDYTEDEIAEALYSGRGDAATQVRNAMAWFALEEVARELNPDI